MLELELRRLQEELEQSNQAYALATVISVKGSASAKVGSKCLISHEGKNLWGWVGGGCAESYTIANALEALEERAARIITADLDDEVFGLGMPCGGVMDIFVEPRFPREKLVFAGQEWPALRALAEHYGYAPVWEGTRRNSPAEVPLAELVKELARAVAQARNLDQSPLTLGPREPRALPATPPELLILGHSRITEELAKLGALLGWSTRVYGLELNPKAYPATVRAEKARPDYEGLDVKPGSFVVVASHHKGDHHYIQAALGAGAIYVGLVASGKRAGLVFEHLRSKGVHQEQLAEVRAPAGLRMGCKNPAEIALSVVAEMLAGMCPR